MRRATLIAGVAIAAAICTFGPAISSAGASTHFAEAVSFPDVLCGFNGITELSGIDNFGSLGNGGTYDNGRLVQTFTAVNDRAVEIDYVAGREVFSPLTVNPDGTFTQTITASGLDVLTKAVGGPVLAHGAGRIEVTVIEDANGDTLAVSAVSLAGQNPNLTGAPDCSVIGPYLQGS